MTLGRLGPAAVAALLLHCCCIAAATATESTCAQVDRHSTWHFHFQTFTRHRGSVGLFWGMLPPAGRVLSGRGWRGWPLVAKSARTRVASLLGIGGTRVGEQGVEENGILGCVVVRARLSTCRGSEGQGPGLSGFWRPTGMWGCSPSVRRVTRTDMSGESIPPQGAGGEGELWPLQVGGE